MPILYQAARPWLRVGLDYFFADIEAVGVNQVPAQGPVIFVANHPNSVMDPLVLATRLDRSIHFLARSGLFAGRLANAAMSAGGAIPVYRAQDGSTAGNDAMFEAVYRLLAGGGCLGIFPEGHNAEERAVGAIRTGAARIALGAEKGNAWSLGLHIVPVGLNYEDRDRFTSRVLVRFGDPIEVALYRSRCQADERAAVQELTEEILLAMRTVATHIDEARYRRWVRLVQRIAGREVYGEVFGESDDKPTLDDTFFLEQRIGDAVAYHHARDPERVESLGAAMERYGLQLKRLAVRDKVLTRQPEALKLRKEAVRMTVYVVAMAPLAVLGALANGPAYWLASLAARGAPEEALRAIRGFAAGMVLYGLWYALIAYGVWHSTGSTLWPTAVLASLPFLGLFWFRYRRQVDRYRERIFANILFRRRGALAAELRGERVAILERLDALRSDFVAAEGSQVDAHRARRQDK
jgi:glycerol-3-phosphate O-acyltransferase / dihydroxyacetone phosphate acyltransferase